MDLKKQIKWVMDSFNENFVERKCRRTDWRMVITIPREAREKETLQLSFTIKDLLDRHSYISTSLMVSLLSRDLKDEYFCFSWKSLDEDIFNETALFDNINEGIDFLEKEEDEILKLGFRPYKEANQDPYRDYLLPFRLRKAEHRLRLSRDFVGRLSDVYCSTGISLSYRKATLNDQLVRWGGVPLYEEKTGRSLVDCLKKTFDGKWPLDEPLQDVTSEELFASLPENLRMFIVEAKK